MKDKIKIDFTPEYSNTNLCSDDNGGCGYDKAVCVCDFRKSYHEKSKEKNETVQLSDRPAEQLSVG